MKQTKTVYLVFALIAIVVLIMVVQTFKSSEKVNIEPKKATSEPIIQFTPPKQFTIASTNITDQTIQVSGGIKITFNKPVNNESLALKITPKTELSLLFNSDLTELTIKPAEVWNFDTRYTIKIAKSTRSQDNHLLDKNYEFSFQTQKFVGI